MKRGLVLADWLAVLGGSALLLMVVCIPARAQTESKPSEQLVAAAKDGDFEEVQRLVDAGAHLPGTLNSFRAIKFAKDGGHDEVLELLEAGLNEYVESGTFYDKMIEGTLDGLRNKVEEESDPGEIRWNLLKRITASGTIGFYNGLKEDPDGLMYPLGMAFDEEEYRRRFDPAFAALQEEYQVESDFERKMRENEEAWEALMKEIQSTTDQEGDENQSKLLFESLPRPDDGE